MASPILFSRPPPDFNLVSVSRGIQLAIVGAYRTLANPCLSADLGGSLLTSLLWSLGISLILQALARLPILVITILLRILSWFNLISPITVHYVRNFLNFFVFKLLNVSPFLVIVLKYLDRDMDVIFWSSLRYSDRLAKKRRPSGRVYADRLLNTNYQFASEGLISHQPLGYLGYPVKLTVQWMKSLLPRYTKLLDSSFTNFIVNYLLLATRVVAMYCFSKIPYVGRFILPATAFQLLNDTTGTFSALSVFVMCFLLNRQDFSLAVITTTLGSKMLMSVLLEPYFDRLPFTKNQLQRWHVSRVGCLTGFSLFYFYFLVRTPFPLSVLSYILAQGSTSFLLTKVSDPPPILSNSKLTGSLSPTVLSPVSSSARLVDLETLTLWADGQCEWEKDYYKELDELFDELDAVIPGTLKSSPPTIVKKPSYYYI